MLSRFAWDALVHGMTSLGTHHHLKTLWLSNVAIKIAESMNSSLPSLFGILKALSYLNRFSYLSRNHCWKDILTSF